MPQSYFIIITLILVVAILADISFSKVMFKFPIKLVVALSFLFIIFLLRIYMGVKMNLWTYGEGILGNYIYNVPIEEYLFMVIAPYSTIVLWETIHKALRRR